eukprot:CAMPEP_0119009202 /NCGR_PEP_ID=MMETSP1176-20130426/4210_1 /TAXON_ID=265551 /ORGANISM="Synedropsis recta cf, Strain CCMP1620" /LENGTH=133 /DNA_ID=CAMNT_0006961669 /DNA_START=16 /DNA_END=417 /DNA_ORIENTATION=-
MNSKTMNIIFLLLATVVGGALADQLQHDSSNSQQEEQHGIGRRKLDRMFVIEEDISLWGRLLEEEEMSMGKSRKSGKSGKKGGSSSSKKGKKGGSKKQGSSPKGTNGSRKQGKVKEKDAERPLKQSKQRRLRN